MGEAAGPRVEHCLILGAGIIGLSVAWRATQAGMSVTLVDPSPGRGASHVAAGMLAPVSEAHWGEELIGRINLESARLWPSFASELVAASDRCVDLGDGGTLMVGFDADDMAVVADVGELHARRGLHTQKLRSAELRRTEPLLSPSVRGGVLVPDERRVDPRTVVDALVVALGRAGARFIELRATRLLVEGGRAVGAQLEAGGEVRADAVVLACGCWSGDLDGLPSAVRPGVRPVKGQLLVLRSPSPELSPTRSVRGWVRGSGVYLVPRSDGRVVVGATQEERGFDTTVTAGAVHDLLRDATTLFPALLEHELVEAIAGLRPATADNHPLIGPSPELEGLVLATGHHRNGVLLAPITAERVVGHLMGSATPRPPGDAPDQEPIAVGRLARGEGSES